MLSRVDGNRIFYIDVIIMFNYMSIARDNLEKVIEKGEQKGGNIEFKLSLDKDIHLVGSKRNSLTGQMKHRILSGEGEAKYVIGIRDNGSITGISEDEFEETRQVLVELASDMDAEIDKVEKWEVEDSNKYVGLITIKESPSNIESNHIIIGTAGHVDHGKSTLVSSLVNGKPDDGNGLMREEVDLLEHEIKRGLSADLSYTAYGFKDDEALRLGKKGGFTKAEVVEKSDRILSFVDTVGHQPWLGTTIRGLVGQRLDYGLLTVSATDGVTDTTKEHLGILVAMDLPIITAITKTDLVEKEQIRKVEKEVKDIMNNVGIVTLIENDIGIDETKRKMIKRVKNKETNITTVLRTSSVNMDGMEKLDTLVKDLPKIKYDNSDEFKLYIDKTYKVEGVGTVISGTIKSGEIEKGDTIYIGPDSSGNYHEVKAQSLEIHYHEVDKAQTGQLVSISISDLKEKDIERGMVALKQKTNSHKEFEAELMVLNHPTSITNGYEPVIHLETITESVKIKTKSQLLPGEKGKVDIEFKFKPYYIEEGQQFVFREGKSKGIGTITKIN